MMKTRMIQLSVFQAVCDLFRKPVEGADDRPTLSQPWNVYSEADLRANRRTVFPYVYLIDSDSPDLALRAPVIIVDFSSPLRHFQLELGGTNYAKAAQLVLHCIGRNKGESSDMGSYIAENMRSIPIYNYNSPVTPGVYPALDTRLPDPPGSDLPESFFQTSQILQIDPFVGQGRLNVPARQRFQGMMTSAELITFRFISTI
jgi:hypothetical protein